MDKTQHIAAELNMSLDELVERIGFQKWVQNPSDSAEEYLHDYYESEGNIDMVFIYGKLVIHEYAQLEQRCEDLRRRAVHVLLVSQVRHQPDRRFG